MHDTTAGVVMTQLGMERVYCVLFYVPLRPGSLVLAEMEDGSLRILKDDEPVDECHWPASAMQAAVTAFQELKTELLASRA